MDLGPTRRWKVGDILMAENDFIRMAYAVDDKRVGEEDWHGPEKIRVEYISSEAGKLWD